MAATEDDIAKFTTDGVVLTAVNNAILEQDSNAVDGAEGERQLFFDDEAAGQILLDELFAFVSKMGKIHEAIEIGDGLGLGTVYPLWPAVPGADVSDATRGIESAAILRAYSFDMTSDRYALEFVGTPGDRDAPVTFDSTLMRFDSTKVTWDANYRVIPPAPGTIIGRPAVTFDSLQIRFDSSRPTWDIAS